jgi:hypothetical protein
MSRQDKTGIAITQLMLNEGISMPMSTGAIMPAMPELMRRVNVD